MFEKLIKEYTDQLSGGIGDKKNPSDFDKEKLEKGIKVELEHTDDPKLALEIAIDHLSEDLEYYAKLEKMEKNSMKVKNASTLPQVYYGLHMVEGIAHYKPADGEPYTIFVGERACKNLDPTFVGRPVYVDHVDGVDLENLQEEADGYVVDSFFNKSDGKHWAKFLVVSDKGHEAIRNGWKLSNAYLIKSTGPAGVWHGAEYSTEVVMGEYEHLAIVSNPRYAESIILTPEQFKEYNTNKEKELSLLQNSNEEKNKPIKGEHQMFKIFKKQKVENSNDLNFSEMMITLPKSGKDVSFEKLVNMAEEEKKENGDDKIKVGEEEMTVNELKEKYMNMCKKKNEEDEEAKKKENEEEEEKKRKENMTEEEKAAEKKSNEEEEEKKKENMKKKNSLDVAAAELVLKNAKEAQDNFDKIGNAADNYFSENPVTIETSVDQVERGNNRYGSSK